MASINKEEEEKVMRKFVKFILIGLFANLVSVYSVSALEIGQPAPDFQLPQIGTDKIVGLDEFKGKVVYIDFWASWCAPCRVSFPLLNQLYQEKRSQGFEIVAINLDEDDNDLKRFLKLYSVDFTLVRDKASKLPESYQVQAMPSSFIVDKSGVIRHIHKGFKKGDMPKINAEVETLLKDVN